MELHVGDVVLVKGTEYRGTIVKYYPNLNRQYDVDFEDGSPLAFAEFELELDTQASPRKTGTSATETHMNVGDKVRVLPSEDHSHSNRNGTIARAEIMISPGDTDCFRVKLVSPTRRPSLISHTTYQRATLNVVLYSDELEVV